MISKKKHYKIDRPSPNLYTTYNMQMNSLLSYFFKMNWLIEIARRYGIHWRNSTKLHVFSYMHETIRNIFYNKHTENAQSKDINARWCDVDVKIKMIIKFTNIKKKKLCVVLMMILRTYISI